MVERLVVLLSIVFLFFSVAVSIPLSEDDLNARRVRSANPSDALKIAIADTKGDSESKADHGSASSSSSTNGNAASVSKHLHLDDHQHSKRSLLDMLKIAFANSQAVSIGGKKDGAAFSASHSAGSAVHVSNQIKDESKTPIPHRKESDHKPIEVEGTTPHAEDNMDSEVSAPLSPPATEDEAVEEHVPIDVPSESNEQLAETKEEASSTVSSQEPELTTESVPEVIAETEKSPQTTPKPPSLKDLGIDIDFMKDLFM